MQALIAPSDAQIEMEHSSRYISSQDLARGVEVQELSLRDMSNGHLQELVRMLRGWRQRSIIASPFAAASSM